MVAPGGTNYSNFWFEYSPPHRTTARGATIIGATSTDGYEHYESKAIRDGDFVGLTCDEQNQFDMSEDRVKEWVVKIKGEGMPL